jgi:putative transposase
MRTYIRRAAPGACYFFTVNLANRRGNDLLTRHIHLLKNAFRLTCAERPFRQAAFVIMPEHLHCLWQLPEGDSDYPMRWRLIKARFSHALPHEEPTSASRRRKRERGIWQRRYWEHEIRDEPDYLAHVEYIHNNPVKHGYVTDARQWPHSSIHRFTP